MLPLSSVAIGEHTQFPIDHIHFRAHVLPKSIESMVAENGLGPELLSGCGAVSTGKEDWLPYYVWVFNMLDFIIMVSMDIGQQVTPPGFLLDLVEILMVCDVNEPRGVFLALEDLCCPI